MKKALALLTICTAAACDVAGIDNMHPIAIGLIESDTISVNEQLTIIASNYFSDPDGDSLTYAVSSSDPQNLATDVAGDQVTIDAIGETTATVVITATDIHDADAQLSFDITVLGIIRYEFDSAEGWVGWLGVEPAPDVASIDNGHLVLSVSGQDTYHSLLRDIGTYGPNWKVSTRFQKTEDICGGILLFPEGIQQNMPPKFAWALELSAFASWHVSLYVAEIDTWLFLKDGEVPPDPDPDGYHEISLGLTEDKILYGHAHGDFKLFEFDLDVLINFTLPPTTITHFGVSGFPCPTPGEMRVDWFTAEIRPQVS